MKPHLLRLCLAFSLAVAGCAAPTDDEDESSSEAAVGENPVYAAVARSGTKIETDRTRNADQSAKTHLVGFIRGGDSARVLDRLLSVARWTEISDGEGYRPFTRAEMLSDRTQDGVRTVAVKVTLDGGVALEIRGTSKSGADKIEIRMTNSTAYRHWLIGTVLDENKLQLSFDLVPFRGGVIVDATLKAKLKKKEDRAAELTGAVGPIFSWLAAGSR